MNTGRQRRKIGWLLGLAGLCLLVCFAVLSNASVPGAAPPWSSAAQKDRAYVVLAWNNLGMHCYNPDFQDFAVLPPYNTLWAQVFKVGDPPQVVTGGITVEYRFPDNTYSVGKTNFWKYARQLFSLQQDLPPNIGLTGKGLSGTMDLDANTGDHFVAEGIPLTEYNDNDKKLRNPSPYQLAEITVRDESSRAILVQTMAVAPVSSELNCINCHADDGDATMKYAEDPLSGQPPFKSTGRVETNILALHDYLNGKYNALDGLMKNRPVLCANCHSSNALGSSGVDGVPSLSFAMHNHHNNYPPETANAPDITPNTTEGCYNCHPGRRTQCLRDTMSQNFAFNCTTCHGNMADVASPSLPLREPWLTEPRCDSANCHGSGYALDQALYRNSRGHGGTYCVGCHDSPHALAPSREPNDSLKFNLLQGQSGTLRKCTVCHATQPMQAFRHSWAALGTK